jgi:hypothetical protein
MSWPWQKFKPIEPLVVPKYVENTEIKRLLEKANAAANSLLVDDEALIQLRETRATLAALAPALAAVREEMIKVAESIPKDNTPSIIQLFHDAGIDIPA